MTIKKITGTQIIFGNVPIYGPYEELVRIYNEVGFNKDVPRDESGKPQYRTLIGWIKYFERMQKVLPPLCITMACIDIALDNASEQAFLNNHEYKEMGDREVVEIVLGATPGLQNLLTLFKLTGMLPLLVQLII